MLNDLLLELLNLLLFIFIKWVLLQFVLSLNRVLINKQNKQLKRILINCIQLTCQARRKNIISELKKKLRNHCLNKHIYQLKNME